MSYKSQTYQGQRDDEIRITVQDDLSGLLILRMVASGFEEVR